MLILIMDLAATMTDASLEMIQSVIYLVYVMKNQSLQDLDQQIIIQKVQLN